MSATLLVFSITFLVGLPLTWLAMRVGQHFHFLDRPSTIKPHKVPVPYTGGTAIVIVVVITMIILGLLPLALAAVFMWAIGFADDVRSLPPRLKLLVETVPLVLGSSALGLSPLHTILGVIVGVILVNAFNVVDGLDGLAAGCALAPLLVFVSFGGIAGLLATTVAASVAAFLCFNRHPAKIFLGDEGSLLLGFTLWSLPFMAGVNSATPSGALLWVGLWLFPLVDAGFVVVFRLRAHRPIMRGDRSHLYDVWHKQIGLTPTLLACWSIVAIGSIGATITTRL